LVTAPKGEETKDMKAKIRSTAVFERIIEVPDECGDRDGVCEWLADHE